MSTGRVAYVNGEILPESQASVSINDRGFLYGDAVFDTTRTFNGEIFRLEQHLDRFYESLRYMRIDSPVDKAEMKEVTLKILDLLQGPALSSLLSLPEQSLAQIQRLGVRLHCHE